MINKVLVAGRIQDVAERVTPRGKPILEVTLVVEDTSWDGEFHEECRVTARMFGERRVKALAPHIQPQRVIAVTGRLSEGAPAPFVVIDHLEFLPDTCRGQPLWAPARAA